jgi:hypothetical protein
MPVLMGSIGAFSGKLYIGTCCAFSGTGSMPSGMPMRSLNLGMFVPFQIICRVSQKFWTFFKMPQPMITRRAQQVSHFVGFVIMVYMCGTVTLERHFTDGTLAVLRLPLCFYIFQAETIQLFRPALFLPLCYALRIIFSVLYFSFCLAYATTSARPFAVRPRGLNIHIFWCQFMPSLAMCFTFQV